MSRKYFSILLLAISFSLIGCSSIKETMSEEEAVERFIDGYDGNIGEPEIISIEQDKNTYIIEWINEENLERGRHRVKKDGKIETIEREIE